MIRVAVILSTLLFCGLANSEGPAEKLKNIFNVCKVHGFSSEKCNHFIAGPNRGFFHLVITDEILKETEREFKAFLDSYPSSMGFYIEYGMVDFNFSLSSNWDTTFEELTDEKFVMHGNFWVLLDSEERSSGMGLVQEGETWKLIFSDQFEDEFLSDERYTTIYRLAGTRINILRFHIAKAKKEKISRNALINAVNEASIPLVLVVEPDREPELKKWVKYGLQETIDFYNNKPAMQKALEDGNTP